MHMHFVAKKDSVLYNKKDMKIDRCIFLIINLVVRVAYIERKLDET